jgi:hypothetical protein
MRWGYCTSRVPCSLQQVYRVSHSAADPCSHRRSHGCAHRDAHCFANISSDFVTHIFTHVGTDGAAFICAHGHSNALSFCGPYCSAEHVADCNTYKHTVRITFGCTDTGTNIIANVISDSVSHACVHDRRRNRTTRP